MIQMDEINKMKKAHREGCSINEIAKRFNRSWETVKMIVEKSSEEIVHRGKRPRRQKKVITTEVIQAIDSYLDEEIQSGIWKKQKYTASVIFKKLCNKNIYHGAIRQLQETVKLRRIERAQVKPKTYLPLEFSLGTTAQFDHGEAECVIEGKRGRFYLFVCSVPNSGLRYCQIFPVKSKEAWGEFHERAYHFFGGIFPVNVYDNDSVLVKEVLGSERKQTSFSLALEDHYKMKCCFCNVASGNEKGAVENAVGYCRRNYLSGLCEFRCWNDVNEHLERSCIEEINSGVHYRTGRALKEIFAEVNAKTEPLLPPYHWRCSSEALVNHLQMVTAKNHGYSVPEKYTGNHIVVEVHVFKVELYSDGGKIASHPRIFDQGEDSLLLDHYLDQLQRKPGALWDCKPVHQHLFEDIFLTLRDYLNEQYPEKNEANRLFIEIIILHRKFGKEKLIEGIQEAFMLRAVHPDAIKSIIRNLIAKRPDSSEIPLEACPKIKIDTLEYDTEQYEQLVGGGY